MKWVLQLSPLFCKWETWHSEGSRSARVWAQAAGPRGQLLLSTFTCLVQHIPSLKEFIVLSYCSSAPSSLRCLYFVLFLRNTFPLVYWTVTPCVQIAKLLSGCSKFCFPVVNLRNLILSQRGEMKWNSTMCAVFLQVIVKVNNGIRDFSTSVTPKQSLCDGRWHRITGEESCVSWVSLIKWAYTPTSDMMTWKNFV